MAIIKNFQHHHLLRRNHACWRLSGKHFFDDPGFIRSIHASHCGFA